MSSSTFAYEIILKIALMLCWTPLYVHKHKQCKQDITPPTNNLRSIHYAILIEKHVIRPCAAWLKYLCFQCHSDINKQITTGIRINISITNCFRILLINLNVYIIYMCVIIMCNIELINKICLY
jgi:hypothetical protein